MISYPTSKTVILTHLVTLQITSGNSSSVSWSSRAISPSSQVLKVLTSSTESNQLSKRRCRSNNWDLNFKHHLQLGAKKKPEFPIWTQIRCIIGKSIPLFLRERNWRPKIWGSSPPGRIAIATHQKCRWGQIQIWWTTYLAVSMLSYWNRIRISTYKILKTKWQKMQVETSTIDW